MRVLHVIPDTDRRGSAVFAQRLTPAIGALGHESSLVALEPGVTKDGLTVETLVADRGGSAKKQLKARMREVDVTVAHGPAAGAECERAAGRKVPFVYRLVRDTRSWQHRPSNAKDLPSFMRRADVLVAMSPLARADLVESMGFPGSKVHVIPLGVPSTEFRVASRHEREAAREHLGIDQRDFVAVTLGALRPDKGVDFAIRAAIATDSVRLVVAGDGPERDRLERLAEGLAPGRVVFTGRVAHPMEVYAAADVVVRPSVSGESISAVLIEAGFCGLPVITTPIGSFEHVIEHGVNGLVVPSMDQHGLRASLEMLRVGRRGRQSMGEEAHARAIARFDLDVVAKEWVQVLESVIAGR